MRNATLAVLLLGVVSVAQAKDVEIVCGTCNTEFKAVSEDLVAAIDYKAAGPSEATGIAGFGVGLVGTYVSVGDEWETLTGNDFSAIGLAGIQVTKGLPFGIDLGAFYATAPGSNVDVTGAELRYAILKGSTVSPALAVRLSYVTVSGIESFDLDSTAVDVSVSKGFGPFTPYAGAGYVMGTSDPDVATLEKVDVEEMKLYAGARFSLGFIEFTPEVDQIGDVTSFSLRTGFSFGL